MTSAQIRSRKRGRRDEDIWNPLFVANAMQMYLEEPEFDSQLQRTVAAAYAGATDIGEALATARCVLPGDYGDWFGKWSGLATAMGEKAAAAAKVDTQPRLKKGFLRATAYWRQSIFFVRHNLDDERLQRS